MQSRSLNLDLNLNKISNTLEIIEAFINSVIVSDAILENCLNHNRKRKTIDDTCKKKQSKYDTKKEKF